MDLMAAAEKLLTIPMYVYIDRYSGAFLGLFHWDYLWREEGCETHQAAITRQALSVRMPSRLVR